MIDLTSRTKKWVGGAIVLLFIVAVFPWLIGWRMQNVAASIARGMSPPITGISLNQELGLTESQKNQIQLLEKKYKTELRALCERHCSARIKIGKLLQAGQTNDQVLLQLTREVNDAYASSEEATLRHVLAVCAVLDSRQKAAFLHQISACLSATCPKELLQ